MREIVILGSTGSIGVQALEIIAAHPEEFRVVGISAGSNNSELLMEQARKFKVDVVGTTGDGVLLRQMSNKITVIDGANAAAEVAAISCDLVLNAITGSVGLGPTLAALQAGNRLALANKESLVAGGDLVMAFGRDRILPVDSEHSALYQVMASGKESEISRVILTASGGPFRDREDLSTVTIAQALAHPTWVMGPVVTINSATLVNKGLEIIEAHYLFGIPYSKIDAVIHPQSIVHSMVEFFDGSTIAQASPPNMKGPIAYALGYPDRMQGAAPPLDWTKSQSWSFSPIDPARFPAVALARRCGELGAGVIFNAANEVAVAGFLSEKITFSAIVDTIEKVVAKLLSSSPIKPRDFSDVSAIEQDARLMAEKIISGTIKI